MAPPAEDERLGRDPPRVREPARALVHALAGVSDPGPGRQRRVRPARLLDRLRPPAPRLDDPARRLGPADRGAGALDRRRRRRACSATGSSRGWCWRAAAASGSRPRRGRRSPRARPWSRRSTSSTWSRWRPAAAWGDDFVYGVETYDVGLSGFAVYMAATRPPAFETAGRRADRGLRRAGRLAAGAARPRAAAARRHLRPRSGLAAGRDADPRRPLAGARGPPHGQVPQRPGLAAARGRVELGRAQAGARRRASSSACAASRPASTTSAVLEMLVKSPFDIEASNRHMIRGAFHGGDRGLAQSGALRPVPGWGSTGCRSRASTRPAAPPTRAARSPARPGATRRR